MGKDAQFDWVPFYRELAEKLLPYQNNRQELIEKVRQIYTVTGIGMVQCGRYGELCRIRSGICQENRLWKNNIDCLL